MTHPKLDMTEITRPAAWDRVASGYADFVLDTFRLYSADALRLAALEPGELVLDVATGPGTLALQAADITRVHALDFSSEMLAELQNRVTEAQLANLSLHQGDGQALPFEADTFDAAFSMFGLFMFPDRARGFSELARVLKPGGRAVVASWQPLNNIPHFGLIDEELGQFVDRGEAEGGGGPPLSDPEVFAAEMRAAGFVDVRIEPTAHVSVAPSTAAMWAGLRRGHVALGIAADQLPEARYQALLAAIEARLLKELGEGPQSVEMPAWLGAGRAP